MCTYWMSICEWLDFQPTDSQGDGRNIGISAIGVLVSQYLK